MSPEFKAIEPLANAVMIVAVILFVLYVIGWIILWRTR